MVSLWGIDSYFNLEQIQIRDIEIMIYAYGLSGSFGSRVRSKYIGHNTYKAKEIFSVRNQHQFMDQFKNLILIFHNREVTSVGYHTQLLKISLIICIRKPSMLLK